MKNRTLGNMTRITIAAVALIWAPLASAQVGAGSVVRLGNGVGSLAGIFDGSVVSGPGAGNTFLSFCLERYESFDYFGQNLYVQGVTDHTVNATGRGSHYGSSGMDYLSDATAWLFTQFSTGALGAFTTQSRANSMQQAIWYLEGETSWSSLSSQARSWANAANAADAGGWNNNGTVGVLNLFKDANYRLHSQDQIVLVSAVPEPETFGMMLAGLGLMGAVARRRNKAKQG